MLERIKTLLQEEILKTPTEPGLREEQVPIVARQPVFDLKGAIWGYELLYRQPATLDRAVFRSGAAATASVIVNGLEMIRPGIRDKQKILINFPGDLIETQVAKLLPRDICIVEILETVQPTQCILEAVYDLRTAGYAIALDDYAGQENLNAFLPLADIVKVDVLNCPRQDIAIHAAHVRKYNCKLLAEKVEDADIAALCQDLGFRLFQGYFFARPEIVRGRKVYASHALRMRILALCLGDKVDFKAVSDTLLHDPVITARFLRFVNSAYFGLTWRIRSVYHALNLVGPVTFMQWLCVSMLATIENDPITQELAFLASQRAKFLETLGKNLEKRRMLPPGMTPYNLYMAGLFSLLEYSLQMPIGEILDGVPIEEEVLIALAGGDTPYSAWLQLMRHYERGEWEEGLHITAQLHLTDGDLVAAYQVALEWSAAFYNTYAADRAAATIRSS